MKKQLRKPENWQDFERLCKILWGEIWNCREIKQNGRSGQQQHGVDVYGTPLGETQYYGIQCKGKDDYTNAILTSKEIDIEIGKAKKFKPALKKFYFATTSNKDAKIEEYIRLQDEISRNAGGFEIHLFSWEDIVDLIDENKRTHDWYVLNIGFKSTHSVEIVFGTGESYLEFTPKLIKNHVQYYKKAQPSYSPNSLIRISTEPPSDARLERLSDPQPIMHYINATDYNLSSCVFTFSILNNGNVPIENFKLNIYFPSSGIKVDTVNKQTKFLDSHKYSYNTFMYENTNNCVFEPKEQIMVQKDKFFTDKICIRPMLEQVQEIIIEYDFLARDFNKKGQLSIKIKPIIEEIRSNEGVYTLIPDEIRLENCYE